MSNQRETTFDVVGMSCGSCARRVDRALRELDGVTDVLVSLREGKALVKHEERSSIDAMVEAVRDAGYSATHEDR